MNYKLNKMNNLKENNETNLGQDGHLSSGGHGVNQNFNKEPKSKFKYVLIGLGIAVLAIILLSIL